jgi:hypothetical protein
MVQPGKPQRPRKPKAPVSIQPPPVVQRYHPPRRGFPFPEEDEELRAKHRLGASAEQLPPANPEASLDWLQIYRERPPHNPFLLRRIYELELLPQDAFQNFPQPPGDLPLTTFGSEEGSRQGKGRRKSAK